MILPGTQTAQADLSAEPVLQTMRALVKTAPEPGCELIEVPVPTPGPDEVRVQVAAGGICGTIVAVGAAVTEVTVGDRVAGESHIACGWCTRCRQGEAHICERLEIIGIDRDGAFADYVVMPARNAWRLDAGIPQDVAAVMDPLGNAVRRISDATGGSGVDAVLEMSGHPAGIRDALRVARRGGWVGLLGLPALPVELDLAGEVIFKAVRLEGIFGRRLWQTWEQMTALLRRGLDIAPIITHRLPLGEFSRAFDLLESGEAGKVILTLEG